MSVLCYSPRVASNDNLMADLPKSGLMFHKISAGVNKMATDVPQNGGGCPTNWRLISHKMVADVPQIGG